jgi:hypothetical protein
MMEEIKKIIAKASYGQDIQSFSKGILINTYDRKKPSEILGCIITDAEILSCALEQNVKRGKGVRVNGKFNVHLWYGLSGDTKIAKVSTNFSDIVMIDAQGAGAFKNEEVRTWIQKDPKYTGASIIEEQEGYGVKVLVEYELGAEIVGQTTLNVKVLKFEDNADEDEAEPMQSGEIMDDDDDD